MKVNPKLLKVILACSCLLSFDANAESLLESMTGGTANPNSSNPEQPFTGSNSNSVAGTTSGPNKFLPPPPSGALTALPLGTSDDVSEKSTNTAIPPPFVLDTSGKTIYGYDNNGKPITNPTPELLQNLANSDYAKNSMISIIPAGLAPINFYADTQGKALDFLNNVLPDLVASWQSPASLIKVEFALLPTLGGGDEYFALQVSSAKSCNISGACEIMIFNGKNYPGYPIFEAQTKNLYVDTVIVNGFPQIWTESNLLWQWDGKRYSVVDNSNYIPKSINSGAPISASPTPEKNH